MQRIWIWGIAGRKCYDCSNFKNLWIDRISIDKNQWHKKLCQLLSWGLILQKMMNSLVPWEETHYMLRGSEGWFIWDNKKNSCPYSPIFTHFLRSLTIHSVSKESQHFWSCLSFGEECIPMNMGAYIISTIQISHDPGSHEPDPGPQEKSTKKSCVSFETECRFLS